MKGTFSFIGWVLFLLAVAGGLILYNAWYVPQARRLAQQQSEIGMWLGLTDSLRKQLDQAEVKPETAFFAVFTFDELFNGPESFKVTKQGEAALQVCVPELQKLKGLIEVTGHTDNSPVPERLQLRFSGNWDYGGAKAAQVLKTLEGWGIVSNRLVLRSFGETRPRDDNSTPEGMARNRRVEILVRK